MNNNNTSSMNQQGTVLIMSVAVIVLIVSLATAYLKAVSPQRGAGHRQMLQRIAHVAARSGQAHAIAAILDDYTSKEFTSYQGRWRQDFYAVASDGTVVQPWETDAKNGTQRLPAYDDDFNVLPEQRIAYMLSQWGLAAAPRYADSGFHDILAAPDDDGARYSVSRWHNIDYMNERMLSIFPPGADEATALNDAQYIIRYASEVLDADSHLNINPDYPVFYNIPGEPGYDASLPSFETQYNSSDPDNYDYLQYQSYLQRFGRAIRSMHGTRDARSTNLHQYLYGYNPYDTERVDIAANGKRRTNTKAEWLISSHRSSSEMFFRGDVTRWNQWANSGENKQQTFIYAGQVHSPWTIVPVFDPAGTQSVHYSPGTAAQLLTPYGQGLRDHGWHPGGPADSPINGSSPNNPNVPWNINLLTVSSHLRSLMLLGMSSHLKFAETRNGSRSSPHDLLGHAYPDPFPLSLDDGRHIDLIGGDENNGSDRINYGFLLSGGTSPNGTIFRPSRNSYWWDSVAGMALAIEIAQKVYNRNWDPTDNTVANGQVFDPDSLLDVTETDPAVIIDMIEQDWLRIIGESKTAPGNGLLASLEHGNKVTIGYGDSAVKSQCTLEPASNTRGMEYLLNDLRMSFFGSSALNFNGDDANNDGVVNSADAESTVNGWWHNGVHMWSWWWDGVHSTEVIGNEWMQEASWYRFWYGNSQMDTAYAPGVRNRIARWNGSEWIEYIAGDPQFDALLAINTPFLNDPNGAAWSSTNPPIKPWSATGRFFVGKSKVYRILTRGQIFDNITAEHAAEVNFESVFNIVEDSSGDLDQSHVIYTRYHINKNTD